MKTYTMLCVLVTAIPSFGSTASADMIAFSLIPADGNVSGPPGSIVGWGYSITNQSSTDWLVTSGLNSDPFLFGTPNSLFDFPDLAPGTTATVAFDPGLSVGFYELTWDTSVPSGFANFGNFTLSSEWWNGDPLANGQFIREAADVSQPYFAEVQESTVFTPEPTSLKLVLFGISLLVAMYAAGKAGRLTRHVVSRWLGAFASPIPQRPRFQENGVAFDSNARQRARM
jgi:hypothetical protein